MNYDNNKTITNKTETLLSSSHSSSSSISSTSPGPAQNTDSAKLNKYNLNVNNFSSASSLLLQSDILQSVAKKHSSSPLDGIKPTSKSTKSSNQHVINSLVNEEKKQSLVGNPFPARHLNKTIAKNGLRLGLYK